ncbi:hypothetical protein OG936_38710 (plasmid) [Streptomyces sp. NBC_00846]|uniref:hypothetical protein n=1 Tax=Streptomyces sp. NBC_00846 TaxID=2975849 RepID=UPI002F909005|nr:hypothetical protein OG936_38710 [Streptomyces sp. NBC_00846]
MDIALVRSRWRAVFAVFAVPPWGLGLPLTALAFGLDAAAGQPDVLGTAMAVAAGAASFATVPAQVETVRALLSRPRLTLETDALVIHDPVFLRKGARIARERIAEADRLDWKEAEVSFRIGYDTTELTPFREPLNVEVRLRGDHGFASARRLHRGTWIWHLPRRSDRSPQFPVPGDALAQLPDAHRHGTDILVRTDSAGSAKAFLTHVRDLRTRGIRTFFSVGYAITALFSTVCLPLHRLRDGRGPTDGRMRYS